MEENEVLSRIINTEGLLLGTKINNIKDTFVKREVLALAINIYHEARGSTKDDMIAVGIVTMNRVGQKNYGNSVEEVVFKPKQFSWTHLISEKNKIPKERMSWEQCAEIAHRVYTEVYTDKRLNNTHHYSRWDIIDEVKWHRYYPNRIRIGSHVYMS